MDWYNEKLKRNFIASYKGKSAKHTFSTMFDRSSVMEHALKKDCCNFNLSEITDLARSYRSSDISSMAVKISLYRTYAQFCIDRGFSPTRINHYSEISIDMIPSLIDKKKATKTYLSQKEIYEIVDMFDNPRDKYIILGPYEGIYGKKFCELLELKQEDILGNNRLRLCTGREIVVTNKLYQIINDAVVSNTAIYNGKERKLVPSKYVYKLLKMGSTEMLRNEIAITGKYYRLREFVGRETFGVKMVLRSGLFNRIAECLKEHESFETALDDIRRIQEQYQNTYSISKLKREYNEMLEMTR